MADPTYEELSSENARLRQKNAELLDELKKARGRLKELEAAQPEGLSELETLRAEVLDLKLHKPVAAMLKGVLVSPKYSAQELAEHYKFELNEAGEIEMRDLEGNPVTVAEKVDGKEVTRSVRFEEMDIWRYLVNTGNFNHIIRGSRASGSGAIPSAARTFTTQQEKAQQPAQAKPNFGLK
ncbi:hypothetical protein [Metapseudomonas boanensis]|uniref:Uncharacterized protein n=1 Tax=Metapseudomonas boanensis TaxID=2822138 RepID=A0ABS5XGP7_9GAMM|nr:hypothetical protein [Pseudomonas boanensis]MBT8766870.1 hypothetical protein [Pseudomonas boanensis]